MSVHRGELYCVACGDYVYDGRVDRAVTGTHCASHGPPPPLAGKRRRVPDVPAAVAAAAPSPLTEAESVPQCATLGLRAFNNLGNTCFMSSVLQALMRVTPLQVLRPTSPSPPRTHLALLALCSTIWLSADAFVQSQMACRSGSSGTADSIAKLEARPELTGVVCGELFEM